MSAKPGVAQFTTKNRPPRRDTSWLNHAECVGVDPELFFDPARYDQALQVCAGCPVKQQCREYGKGMGGGVWGGKVHAHKVTGGLRVLQPCGTEAAYRRHHRAGEQPCQACQEANAAYRGYRVRNR